jgi:hypothetical protein
VRRVLARDGRPGVAARSMTAANSIEVGVGVESEPQAEFPAAAERVAELAPGWLRWVSVARRAEGPIVREAGERTATAA